jgi:hypothetical protein
MHPFATVNEILAEREQEREFTSVLNVWIVSFTLSICLQLPVLYSVGLSLENLDFQISYFVASSVTFICGLLSIHCGLVLMRLRPRLEDTGAIYTVITAPYYPLIQLLNLPYNAALLAFLKGIKAANTGYHLTTPIAAFTTTLTNSAPLLTVLGNLLPFISIFNIAMLANCMIDRLSANRFRIISACGLGVVLITPIIPLSVELQMFIYFTFLNAGGK